MGDEGCVALCSVLRNNKKVVYLNLKGGNIQSKGASAIGALLKSNNTLKTLILEWNSIGLLDQGVHDIADALKVNHTLECKVYE